MNEYDDDITGLLRQMEKAHEEEQKKQVQKINQMAIKMNIKVTRPIFYGSVDVSLNLGKACDYDRGSWRSKVYHVTFEGRDATHTLCGRRLWRANLWIAYLEVGEDTEPPYRKRICKTCAAQEDYILHQLAVT